MAHEKSIEEIIEDALLVVTDPSVRAELEAAIDSTTSPITTVKNILRREGISTTVITDVTSGDVQATRLSEETVEGTNQTLSQLKTTMLEEMDEKNLDAEFDPFRDLIREGTTHAEIAEVLNTALNKKWDDREEYLRLHPLNFAGKPSEQREKAVRATTASLDTPAAIKKVIDELLDSDNTDLTEEDIVVAYGAATMDEAIQIIFEALGETDADEDSYTYVTQIFGGSDAITRASRGMTIQGNAATEEVLRSRFGYTGDFAENHEWMITKGEFMVQFDVDNNIFYIHPETNRVRDAAGDEQGTWNPYTGVIDFRQYIDARAPIGIGTGAYGTAQEGALGVNIVGGRTKIAITEWHKLYGNDLTDIVTGKDYEQVLIDALGLSGMLNFRTNLARAGMSQVDFDIEEHVEERLGEYEVGLHFQYLAGQNINKFIDMPLEEFTMWQKKYESMGIGYKAKKYGRFDQHFLEIVEKTMIQANLDKEGDPRGFENIMAEMMGDKSYASNLGGSRGGGTTRTWRPPAYLSPDYAEISQAVKLTFEQRLGRAPSDAEIVLLSKKMGADHRGEFDAQVQAQKLQFFGAGGDSAGTVQDVNYAARFQEDFASKYEDQLSTLDKIEQSRTLTQNALGSILSADRAAGY